MDLQKRQFPILIFAFLLLGQVCSWAQSRNLTVVVLVNSQNTTGYNPSSITPGEFQRFAERYLDHLQVPYELFDVSSTAPPADLNSRQLIISGHSRLLLPVSWRNAIANAVNAGTGFVNLDSDAAIGNESHIQTIFGATGSTAGTAATQISIPSAVAPNGATPHYIAALQKRYDDPSAGLVYPFHAAADGVVRSATSTLLTNATGTVIARLGSDPLILTKSFGAGRAVHFGTLDYLHADRFGFLMGVDDLFWRSLVWAARKPFVVRGYPRLWSVQMDDNKPGWESRVTDLFDTNLTGQKNADGTGGPWKVTGFVFTDNIAPGSFERAGVIADINAGNLEVSPHSFGDAALGNMYWDSSNGPLTDQKWLANMSAIDTWKQGNGGADIIPSFSRSIIGHYWDLSDNIGYDLWNHFGFRYVTSIQKAGFQAAAPNNGAERLPVRSFWLYEMPPKTPVNPNYTTENFPLSFADDYLIRSRTGLPAQTFFLFATQYTDFARYGRVDFVWPQAFGTNQTVAASIGQLQQYTWRHWSSFGPVQLFTHDSLNYEASTASNRQAVIAQSSAWLNVNGVRHVFMDDLGDYIYARTKSKLTRASFDGSQFAYTFTGSGANADGSPIATRVAVFQGDDEGLWQTVPGFNNGLNITLGLSTTPTLTAVSPNSRQQSQSLTVTLTGTNFLSGATCSFGSGIIVNSCTFSSSSQLMANINISNTASIGTRSVTVTNPDGQSTTLANAFTVNAVPASIHMDFIYPDRTSFVNAGWSFIATTAAGGSRNTEQTGSLAVSYDQAAHPGTLRVPLGSGENWQNLNNSQNTLFFTPPTDWTSFVVKIASFNPTANYQQVGLQAYQNDDNYVHTGRAFVNGSRAEMFREVAQATTYMSTAPLTNTGNLLLRMDRSGNSYSGFYSTTGGSTWISLGSTTIALSNPKLAIMAGANDAGTIPVDLAWAEIFRSGTSPAPTLSTVNPSAGTQGQSLSVVISGANFQSGAVCSFGTGITVNSCIFNSATQITANITIAANATAGARSVTVTNTDAQSGRLTNAFTIENVSTTPTVTSVSPVSGASGVSIATSVSATFSVALNPSTVNTNTFRLLDSTGTAVAASVTYNANTLTATLTPPPSSPLVAGGSYQAIITGGSDGIKDTSGSFMSSNFYWSFATAQTGGCPCSIWTTSATPSVLDSGDAAAVELGVRFRSDVNGSITDLRFYKSSANTGTHVAHLWTNTGTLLASATFNGETASGWQQVTFPSPVAITAGTTYVASYYAPNGRYSRDSGAFASVGVDNGPLHLLPDGSDGVNGVFVYGSITSPPTFPTSTFNSTNYWVDVVFNTTAAPGATLSSISLNPTTVQGGSSSTGTATLTAAAPTEGAIVALSSSDPTVASVPSTVTVPAGATTATFTISTSTVSSSTPVTISGSYQGQQTMTLTVTPATSSGSISNLTLSPTSVVSGGTSTATVTLSSPAPTSGALVTLSSADNTVASVPASVTVAAGNTIATFTISASGVSSSSTTAISASYGGVTRSANLTVTPAALLSVTVSPATVVGGASSTGTVTLNGTAPTSGAVVSLSKTNTAATVPASVTVPGGQKTVTFAITTVPVTSQTTGNVSGSYNAVVKTSGTFTVNPPVLSSITLTPRTLIGGAQSTGTVTLTGATAANETVTLSTTNSAATVPVNVTVPAGANTATFVITTVPVSVATTGTVSGTYRGVTRTSASLTVNPPALNTLVLNPTSVVGGSPSTGTVTLTGVAAVDTTITLASNRSFALLPSNVVIPAGSQTANFVINTTPIASNTNASISATYNGITRSATLTVRAPQLASLTLNPPSVTVGATSTGTVTITGPAPSTGTSVSLSSSNRTVATVPSSVVVAADQTTATFLVRSLLVGTATISGTRGVTQSATLTVIAAP